MPIERLSFYPFDDPRNPLVTMPGRQAEYLRSYLRGIDVKSVVSEAEYFDRDYLSEYSAFYSTSARHRKNYCRRLHFFGVDIDDSIFNLLLEGSIPAKSQLQKYYLGFCVLKPLEATPLGKTVLKWFPETHTSSKRITSPSRKYTVHFAGVDFTVVGLAWQQQDVGVSRCATVAIWTMMQSSAFVEYYAMPTTTHITRVAHLTASLGDRVFPSDGLTKEQIKEAIKELGLTPHVIEGDMVLDERLVFSRERFSAFLSPLIRSGYPVLMIGHLGNGLHATCAVGFRESSTGLVQNGEIILEDTDIEFIYIHDDNIGPSSRFVVAEMTTPSGDSVAALKRSSSYAASTELHTIYPDFIPISLIAAVHNDMRFSLNDATKILIRIAQTLRAADSTINGSPTTGYSLSIKIMKCYEYIGDEIDRMMMSSPQVKRKVRNEIINLADPMGLHVLVMRVGNGEKVILDVLVDCTDSPANTHAIAHILYDAQFDDVLNLYSVAFPSPAPIDSDNPAIGIKVEAF
jgi:hypothetical protein